MLRRYYHSAGWSIDLSSAYLSKAAQYGESAEGA
jgi:hypothetical protein